MARFPTFLLLVLATWACGDPMTNEALAPDATPLVDAPPGPDAEPEGEPVAVTLTLEEPPNVASRIGTFVAFQDGSGAWITLEGAAGVYHASTRTGRFGFLVVCGDDGEPAYRRIIYQTTNDGTAVTQRSCSSVWGVVVPFAISGTVVHADGETIEVSTSTAHAWVDHGDPTTYVAGSMAGTTDLLVSGPTDGENVRYLRHDLETVSSDRTVDVDLGRAMPGELSAIAMDGVPAAHTLITTASSIIGGVGLESPVGSYSLPSHVGSVALAHRLPVALRKPEDVVTLYVLAEEVNSDASMHVARESYDSASVNHALPALPDVVPFTPPAIDADSNTPWTFALPRVPFDPARRLYLSTYSMTIQASAAWVESTPTLFVQNPTSIPGWRSDWNVEATQWLWIGYETRTGTQMTSSGLTGVPVPGAARAAKLEGGSLDRHPPCDARRMDCELLGVRDRARKASAR